MSTPSRPIRLVLHETDRPLSLAVQNILQTRALRPLFDLTVVSTLSGLFLELDRSAADIVLLDLDPAEDPEFVSLARLRSHAEGTLVVALLEDAHAAVALNLLDRGAHDYLLAGQINGDTLPGFLRRTIHRHSSERAVRASEEQFRLMIENASDVILVLDSTGLISYAGPSAERILGIQPDDLSGRNALDYLHRDDRRPFLEKFDKAFDGETLPSVTFRFRHPAGRWVHMEGQGRIVRTAEAKPVCILNSNDVSHRVKMEEELRSQSLRDELTGLHNRRAFVAFFEQQIKQAHRAEHKGISLLFIDLDGFKGINDTHGHKVGDRALTDASSILRTTFRDADIVARLGGDEFVVFLTDGVEPAQVERLKQRLTDSVDEWNAKEQRPYRLAMSVGVVHHDLSERRSTEELLFQADELMYQQKREKKRAKLASVGTAGTTLPTLLGTSLGSSPN